MVYIVTDQGSQGVSRVDDDIKRCSRYLVDVQNTYSYTCTSPWKGLGSASLEETDGPTPERKLVLFSSSDELGSYPAPIGAKFSRSSLFGFFFVIRDDVVLLRMIRLVAPRTQRVGGLRGPHLTRHRSASCFERRTFVRAQ